jgi:bifunctional ADP-heptose synthase (sugar kinase/adenylyltransferase)
MNVSRILEGLRELRVLVVGDICLDRWCTYDPALSVPSAETGIPRIAVIKRVNTPGAGGTVANNLAALGVRSVSVLGAVGADGFAHELKTALVENAATGEEDRPRIDFVNVNDLPAKIEKAVIEAFNCHASLFDVVIVADQAETERGGVVTPAVRDAICAARNNVVWVDSRMRPELFRNVVLKPNKSEADAACRRLFGTVDYRRLLDECNLRLLVVTDGPAGACVVDHEGELVVPGREVQALDICGAGDSFSAGAACALAVTGSAADAARFGNLVASITVTKKGTGTASPEELLAL